MRGLLSLLLVVFLNGNVSAQQLNQEVSIEGKTPFLLGKIDKDGLTSTNYISWFSKNYISYKIDNSVVSEVAPKLKSFEILVFMGTWCGDSKREIPRFYKILEAAEFPLDQLTVVAVSNQADMYKQSPNHEEAGLNIHRVPTFIFYKDGKEVNRIVEHPVETLEKDILNIVKGTPYIPNYELVEEVHKILHSEGVNGLKSERKRLIREFENKVSSLYELNTFSRILYSTNRFEEAIVVLKMNTMLFPDDPRAYQSLSNALFKTGDRKKSIKVLKKAIKRFPENTTLVEQLNALESQVK